MKFGTLKSGEAYAAQYDPEQNKVVVIDTDDDLFTLMERHGFVSDKKEDDEILDDIFTSESPSC